MREVVFAATLTKLEQNIIHTDARHSDVDFLVQCHPQILLSLFLACSDMLSFNTVFHMFKWEGDGEMEKCAADEREHAVIFGTVLNSRNVLANIFFYFISGMRLICQ